jgi:hypothetical protein
VVLIVLVMAIVRMRRSLAASAAKVKGQAEESRCSPLILQRLFCIDPRSSKFAMRTALDVW